MRAYMPYQSSHLTHYRSGQHRNLLISRIFSTVVVGNSTVGTLGKVRKRAKNLLIY